ncbi:MAG: YegP family protein [Clostridia bacterium]|nr:YegP family protein [Clostridia bacterium]
MYADKKGEFRLRLYAANGNLVATTNDGYLSVSAAKKGIESVARAAEGAAIVRNDNLW